MHDRTAVCRQAIGSECCGRIPCIAAPLSAHFVRAPPDGKLDNATYEAIEAALDRVEAPCRSADGARWLTLPERVLALAAELGRAPT